MATSVLVVEDEALIADDIRRTLLHLGYQVPAVAATAGDALREATLHRPSLVLMDISLRGKSDGVAAAALIREKLGIAIVFLTSHSDDATLARAAEVRPYGYVVKPFTDRDLRVAVEVALHKQEVEGRLHRKERWYQSTLQSVGDAVVALDEQGRIAFINHVAERLTGWTLAEALARSLDEVFQITDREGLRLSLKSGGFAVNLPPNAVLLHRQGGVTSIEETSSPIVTQGGESLGTVVVFRDITERRKLEQRLQQAERMATLGTMAATVAHEINNPLSYILSNLEFGRESLANALGAQAGVLPADEVREICVALSEASEGAERVRAIVKSLKVYSRSDGESRGVLDLPDILDAAVKLTNYTTQHHARLVKAYGTTPFVEANEGRLVQVVTNLIVNASQAIPEGDVSHHEIRISSWTDDQRRAVFEVSDTGAGISPENLERIFDPFFSTKSKTGLGLGLSICREVIASFGGEISAESTFGRGTRMRVALPGITEAPPAAASDEPGRALLSRRGRVLVVDDEEPIGRAAARALGGAHEVTLASSGAECLRIIDGGERFDIVICDLMMPNISGVQVYEALSARAPDQAGRFVFLTGGVLSRQTQEFIEKAGLEVLHKPVGNAALLALVARFLARGDAISAQPRA